MNQCLKQAAVVAAVLLCGCVQQPVMVRPTAAQLQQMLPLAVTEVIGQDALTAQDTFTYASVNVLPNPSVPILTGAAGGALGMAIINAEMKAEAKRFAEAHVQPLRASLQGFDAKAALSQSLQQALGGQPALFDHYAMGGGAAGAADNAHGMLIQSSYAMTPDFSALQVLATVSIAVAGKPVYRNILVYQSPRLSLPSKTPADVARMVTQENDRYAALHVDAQISRANAALAKGDAEVGHLRQQIIDAQFHHRQALAQAQSVSWEPDTHAQRLGELWARNNGEALKAALRASGPEIVHMLTIDLQQHTTPVDQAVEARTVFHDDRRTIAYRHDGQMISLATSDDDASLKKPAPPVTVMMPSAGR